MTIWPDNAKAKSVCQTVVIYPHRHFCDLEWKDRTWLSWWIFLYTSSRLSWRVYNKSFLANSCLWGSWVECYCCSFCVLHFFVSTNEIFGRFGKMYFLLERMTFDTPSIGWPGRITLCIVTKVQFVLAIWNWENIVSFQDMEEDVVCQRGKHLIFVCISLSHGCKWLSSLFLYIGQLV